MVRELVPLDSFVWALPDAQRAAFLRWLGYADGGASLLTRLLLERQRGAVAPPREEGA